MVQRYENRIPITSAGTSKRLVAWVFDSVIIIFLSLIVVVLTAFVGLAPEHKLRVIAPDVGGGFGSKIFVYSEETACGWASKKLGVPIKWTAERSESFLRCPRSRSHHNGTRRDG